MPLTALTGPLGKKRAAHLLRRTCFGGTVQEVNTFANLTPSEAIEKLFDPDIPNVGFPVDPLTGNEWISTGNAASEDGDLMRYFLSWHLAQMLGHNVDEEKKLPYIFRERLVYFFHTHFTTKKSVVRNTRSLYYQQALFRLYAFDEDDIIIPAVSPDDEDQVVPKNFRELTKKASVDNAMLVFLDGRFNVKGSPNENYARELLELYSIGRGLEGTVPEPEFQGDYFYFTEQDVQAGALVLSGFDNDDTFSNIDEETGLPRGIIKGGTVASQHAEGIKTFSARMNGGSVVPDEDLLQGGRPTEESVIDEISQLVDLIYNQQETALHICREIYRFFVYHQIDESLQSDIIQDMADIFTANDFKIKPVLEALFTSQHFYEASDGEADNNFGGLIKSPIDLVVGFARNFNVSLPDYETQIDDFYAYTGELLTELNRQGMDYYEPFEVAGYAAYHQYPIFNRSWITTNYLTNRYNFIQRRISNGQNMEMGQVDILNYVRENFTADAPVARDLVIAVAEFLLPSSENLTYDMPDVGELTVERLNYFLTAFLLTLQLEVSLPEAESAWEFRWGNNLEDEISNQLKDLFNAVLQTPEYQLM